MLGVIIIVTQTVRVTSSWQCADCCMFFPGRRSFGPYHFCTQLPQECAANNTGMSLMIFVPLCSNSSVHPFVFAPRPWSGTRLDDLKAMVDDVFLKASLVLANEELEKVEVEDFVNLTGATALADPRSSK